MVSRRARALRGRAAPVGGKIPYVEAWSQQSGIRADVHAHLHATRLPDAVESALYRIVQKALTNVAKHSGATRVSVVVERNNAHVHAIVEDDGLGFDPLLVSERGSTADTHAPRLGLLGIQERVTLLGGTMEVDSAPGGSTMLFARLPVDEPATDRPVERSSG